jgi:glycogen(starch) synthase
MRVLMFGWEFPPFSSGGLGTHCYGLTKSMHKLGNEIIFVMPSSKMEVQHDFLKIIQAGRGKTIKIKSWITPYKESGPFPSAQKSRSAGGADVYGRSFFDEVSRYNQLAAESVDDEEFDVIHCHDWMTFPAGIAVKKKTGKPLVVSVHSTEFDRTGGIGTNSWICDIEWSGTYHADKVITVSNYMKRQLMERYSVPSNKINVVYNAVDKDIYAGERECLWPGKKVVLFLGRVTLQKGPDYFLDAAAKVLRKEKNVRFVLAGKGDMLHAMIEKSISLGIADHVVFTGHAQNIERLYRSANLYVMPSVSEPFGITALEALSSGTPLIISKQSGVSEVVSHCFKVDFWDTDELANKMLGVLKYSGLETELSRNGRADVQKFDWNEVAGRTLGVYSSAMAGRGP